MIIDRQPLDQTGHIIAFVSDDGGIELRSHQVGEGSMILSVDQVAHLRELLWRHEPEHQVTLSDTDEDGEGDALYTVSGRAAFEVTLNFITPGGAIEQAQHYLQHGFADPNPSFSDATLRIGKIVVEEVEKLS